MGINQARRGEIVVLEFRDRQRYFPGIGVWTPAYRYEVHIVTSVTREGVVKATRDANGLERPVKHRDAERVLVMPKKVNADAAMKAAQAHTWSDHPEQPRPYYELNELRQMLLQHVIEAGN
jgi:hypothetical protein